MRYTRHAASRLAERAGIDARKLVSLMQARKLTLADGECVTEEGTLVVRQGCIVTFLEPEMAPVRRAQ